MPSLKYYRACQNIIRTFNHQRKEFAHGKAALGTWYTLHHSLIIWMSQYGEAGFEEIQMKAEWYLSNKYQVSHCTPCVKQSSIHLKEGTNGGNFRQKDIEYKIRLKTTKDERVTSLEIKTNLLSLVQKKQKVTEPTYLALNKIKRLEMICRMKWISIAALEGCPPSNGKMMWAVVYLEITKRRYELLFNKMPQIDNI